MSKYQLNLDEFLTEKGIALHPHQRKIFDLLISEMAKDDDFARFIIGRRTGKSLAFKLANEFFDLKRILSNEEINLTDQNASND